MWHILFIMTHAHEEKLKCENLYDENGQLYHLLLSLNSEWIAFEFIFHIQFIQNLSSRMNCNKNTMTLSHSQISKWMGILYVLLFSPSKLIKWMSDNFWKKEKWKRNDWRETCITSDSILTQPTCHWFSVRQS